MIGAKVLVVVRSGRQKSNAWMPHMGWSSQSGMDIGRLLRAPCCVFFYFLGLGTTKMYRGDHEKTHSMKVYVVHQGLWEL